MDAKAGAKAGHFNKDSPLSGYRFLTHCNRMIFATINNIRVVVEEK